MFQEALQFYDTPRNVREAIECANYQGGMGNYDIPLAGAPLPVFRKPCGCVLKLTSGGDDSAADPSVLTWTCVSDDVTGHHGDHGVNGDELKIPRVKLTGQGRMPVVDMSKINASRCLSEPPRDSGNGTLAYENVGPRGLPPPHPTSPTHALYAQVNKSRKSSHNINNKTPVISNNSETANYTNLDFANSLPLYENSRDLLSRVPDIEPKHTKPGPEIELPPRAAATHPEPSHTGLNYLNMSPKRRANYEMMTRDGSSHVPVNGYQPVTYDNLYPLCESIESMAIMCDSKFNTIKQMPKNFAGKEIAITPAMSNSYHSGQYGNGETMTDVANMANNVLNYVTMPRHRVSDNILAVSRSSSLSSTVTMRRSASVPCKQRQDRDSTSSGGSDSGVSTGSPRQSITDQMDFIK